MSDTTSLTPDMAYLDGLMAALDLITAAAPAAPAAVTATPAKPAGLPMRYTAKPAGLPMRYAAAAAAYTATRATGAAAYRLTDTITVNVPNPKRQGTAGYIRYSLWHTGQTVAAYLAALEANPNAIACRGQGPTDLTYNLKRGLISVTPAA